MPMLLRKLGVHGKNAPVKKTKTVEAADFATAGIIGQFERKFAVAFLLENPLQELEIFGDLYSSTTYGKDVLKSFWDNLNGKPGKLYVKAHVGNTGSAIDAVVASKAQTDQNDLIKAITRANDIKLKMNAHAASATNHATADTTNFPVATADAQDIAGLIALVNALITAYAAHEADAALASAWAFHFAQETGTHALASTTAVTNLATAITMLADMYTKFNAHDADATAHHGTTSAHQASSTAPASTPVTTLNLTAAYKTVAEYGVSGNRTGYTITNGVRYTTTLAASMATSDTSATVTSVIGIKIGDVVTIKGAGATPGVKSVKVTAVSENANTISWTGAIGITGVAGDVAEVPGFRIRTWRKGLTGLVTEVETQLGLIFCTMEPEVTEYYAPNVHAQNRWVKVADAASASSAVESFPNEVPTVTYLASGADGTAASTAAHWDFNNAAFDGLPVRLIGNCETSLAAAVKDLETYAGARDDSPIVVAVLAENQTKSQLQVIGSSFQRSNDVFQVNVAEWVKVDDPYNTAPNAPYRSIPNMGFVMGAWLQSLAVAGIHVIPCTDQIALNGVRDLSNSNLGTASDQDRTDLASYGINIIQFVPGSGYRIRNLFTPSTSVEARFANGILMRNFIKVSAQDSLQSSENTPNSFNRVLSDKNAVLLFLHKLWDVGSTGNVPEGETFGQQQNATTGKPTKFEDHIEVQADAVNNPQDRINLGERNLNLYFTFPAPAGSIEISTGILLR